ncbi:MAG: T9SS type A sorting domain-containing protein [Chitinophagaceae bacterium]
MKREIKLYCRYTRSICKRTTSSLLFIVLFSFCTVAQTTNISGIVNTYHKVIEIIPSKAGVRVANVTGLNVNSRVMIIQMKGAAINTSNSSGFGTITAMNEAGNYEIATVCFIIGDSVFFFHNLINNYNPSGKVQLVQFGEYYSANVVDTVKAASWDSAAGTGGVIAIYANQDITLNAPIYADSSGNSGGSYHLHVSSCGFFNQAGTGYAYDATAVTELTGGYKGEGISDIPSNLDGAKGSPANGGGGGNNHNNSGGGGANLTAGGNGGANSSGAPVGCYTSGHQGLGGKALSSSGGTKIFLGGGAGAGHANNGTTAFSYGGNGGGIVFVWANNIIGNSRSISSNGGRGGDSQADGAGGGGAGGTIILKIANYTGLLTVAANGGNGGDSYNDNSIVRCFGGGGGGSGGVIYFTGSVPAVTISTVAGSGGQEFNRNTSCLAPVAGLAGINGSFFSSYNFTRSLDPAGYCSYLLPVKLVDFSATLVNKKVILEWRIDNPADIKYFIIERSLDTRYWSELRTIHSLDQTHSYSLTDEQPVPGNNFYRIKFIEKNNTISYSPVKRITTGGGNEFVVYPNPATNKITIAGNFNYPTPIKLLDIAGKTILYKTIISSPAEISLPGIAAGIYFLQVNQSVQKLIIR